MTEAGPLPSEKSARSPLPALRLAQTATIRSLPPRRQIAIAAQIDMHPRLGHHRQGKASAAAILIGTLIQDFIALIAQLIADRRDQTGRRKAAVAR